MSNYKISKTIPMPGTKPEAKGRRGRRNRFYNLPIEELKVGESVQLSKATMRMQTASTKIKLFDDSIKKLLKERNLKMEYQIFLRKTQNKAEIRLWRTK